MDTNMNPKFEISKSAKREYLNTAINKTYKVLTDSNNIVEVELDKDGSKE